MSSPSAAQKLLGLIRIIVPKVPLIVSTTLVHYALGPPKKSWPYKLSITIALLRSFLAQINHVPIKDSQAMSRRVTDEDAPVNAGAVSFMSSVPGQYRDKAAAHLHMLFERQGIDDTKLGWDWRNDPRLTSEPLEGEWTWVRGVDEKELSKKKTVLYLHGGGYFLASIRTHRWATWGMANLADAKALVGYFAAIDYRLAPDSPFPAALQDALAAYLYLLHPPAESGQAAVDPKNLVIMGDSAGGGLTFATMLAIRDAGLPIPAGVIGWSPWLDLLHSMPSVLTNAPSDYLPAEGFTQGGQGSLTKVAKLAASMKPGENVLHHPDLPEIQHYATNAVLGCPYVSPVVVNSLEGTCSMLVIAGDGELLRDEAIVFAIRGAAAKKKEGDHTEVQLLVYDDMPHVFPMFDFLVSARHALQESADFIRRVTPSQESKASPMTRATSERFLRVSTEGETRPLEKEAVQGWQERLGKLGGGPQVLAQLK
ncbi:hypothetical protein BGW38_007341 [Lunasporangiospora selenospora]|uniref:Alpha/beta hydrolase fold-3 domain-containing protein n=1 Tax=Lunasporangiospora selenospora TaxID=979761 RepID=A0A9P6KGW0_9FUNG|nr:hypothetical protein BGW38_007341 [Lunasporangiospora selenospora]